MQSEKTKPKPVEPSKSMTTESLQQKSSSQLVRSPVARCGCWGYAAKS
ncbi:MAG: hypothetical protein V7L05_17645 [Nostoc sp.]